MNRDHQAQIPLRYGPRYATSDTEPRRACPMCGSPLTSPRARFCSAACKQLAYRLRHLPAAASDLTELRHDLQHRRVLTTHTVYECPSCGDRLVGERRCSACGLFCRSLGLGGHCPDCDASIVFAEVLDNDA